ncbi:MAG: TOMM precursor leader peptide-binding protein [Cyanobacteria bacterium SBLK]|nr:TOMM precursor leader peptide-binding protein [Cyanobacteria bacterium SBLK]
MIEKPRFKNCYQAEMIEEEGVLIFSERDSFLLSEEKIYQILASLIDGNRTTQEIIEEAILNLLPEQTSLQAAIEMSATVRYALMEMEKRGYIVENRPEQSSQLTAFCETLNIDLEAAKKRLQTIEVAIKTLGSVTASGLISTLESLHFQISDEADITLVLTDSYLQEELERFNQQALETSHPWMLVKPVGTILWFGPIFHPGKTGCWECLAQRLRGNSPVEEFVRRRKDVTYPFYPTAHSLTSTSQTAVGMAATEVLKWVLLGNQRLEGSIVTHDTLSLETKKHIVVKRPQCPKCGREEFRKTKPQPLILGRRKKTFTTEGGHRCALPQETFRKYQHHISPLTGVVRGLEKVSIASNDLTHTYLAKHHSIPLSDNLQALQQNLAGRSSGKGRSDMQAKVSGLCEAIERYSGIFQGDEIREKASYQKLGERGIHPNACMNFSESQYQNRQEWNAKHDGWFQKVPEPFDEEQEIDWTPVWSLSAEEFKYLPTAYCYYGYPKTKKPDCWADSNGCAAGNTLEEAILQGFMELVERDSVALWWYNCLRKPAIALESFDEPYFQAMEAYYQTLNRELWVLDITSDLNIPTFAAISKRRDREVEDILLGYGTHFDPAIAIQRALSELNQILPSVLFANADGSTNYVPSADPLALEWWKTVTRERHPYLVPDEKISPKVATDYPEIWSDDLREDVLNCQHIIEQQGMEMLVLDQTRPDIGLKVVKVIVPGMRHFWKRLGAGRLYDVPEKMGWLEQPLRESQLNSFPMWM